MASGANTKKTTKTTTGPAKEEALWQLWHGLLAECQKMLASPEKLGATEMGVIRAFLKDNNIVIDAEHEEVVRANLTRLGSLGAPFPPLK